MNVKKYIQDQYKRGHDFQTIRNHFVKSGYDRDIVEAELNSYKRNRLVAHISAIAIILAIISVPFIYEPSMTGHVIKVRAGKAVLYMSDATGSAVLYSFIFIVVVITLYFLGRILYGNIKNRALGEENVSQEAAVKNEEAPRVVEKEGQLREEEVGQSLQEENPEQAVSESEVKSEEPIEDVVRKEEKIEGEQIGQSLTEENPEQAVSESSEKSQDENEKAVNTLVPILQANYDAGFSLHRLYAETIAKGWEEEVVEKAIAKLKVKESDELLKEEL